jgi:hypothetical protein
MSLFDEANAALFRGMLDKAKQEYDVLESQMTSKRGELISILSALAIITGTTEEFHALVNLVGVDDLSIIRHHDQFVFALKTSRDVLENGKSTKADREAAIALIDIILCPDFQYGDKSQELEELQ